MKRIICCIIIIALCGCIAIIDESKPKRKVHTFGTTEEDVLDTLNQGANKGPDEKVEILIFKGTNAVEKDQQQP